MFYMDREKILSFINRAYATACAHGFHDEKRSDAHYVMLMLSEIGEMVEADRKNRRAVYDAVEYCEKHVDETPDINWGRYFERDVKDTLEDELADVVIRIFDFCGLRRIKPAMSDGGIIEMQDEFNEIFGKMSVCEQCFALSCLVGDVGRHREKWDEDRTGREIGAILSFCFDFAKFHGFDLEWHIDRKMRFNESRSRKHGKEY